MPPEEQGETFMLYLCSYPASPGLYYRPDTIDISLPANISGHSKTRHQKTFMKPNSVQCDFCEAPPSGSAGGYQVDMPSKSVFVMPLRVIVLLKTRRHVPHGRTALEKK
jgi:hypothetical protein